MNIHGRSSFVGNLHSEKRHRAVGDIQSDIDASVPQVYLGT